MHLIQLQGDKPMTKQDYQIIADAFTYRVGLTGVFNTPARLTHLREIADTIADRMAADNSRFKRDQFMSACGFTPAKGA